MGKYTDYIMKTAQDLLSVPSPSGFTHMAADFVNTIYFFQLFL